MYRYLCFLFVFLCWISFNARINAVIVASGFLMAGLVFFFVPERSHKNQSLLNLIKYMAFLILSIYKSAFVVLFQMFKKDTPLYSFHLKTKIKSPYERMLLANSVTLTPGTLTIDLSGEGLLVLALAPDEVTVKYKGLPIISEFESVLGGY